MEKWIPPPNEAATVASEKQIRGLFPRYSNRIIADATEPAVGTIGVLTRNQTTNPDPSAKPHPIGCSKIQQQPKILSHSTQQDERPADEAESPDHSEPSKDDQKEAISDTLMPTDDAILQLPLSNRQAIYTIHPSKGFKLHETPNHC